MPHPSVVMCNLEASGYKENIAYGKELLPLVSHRLLFLPYIPKLCLLSSTFSPAIFKWSKAKKDKMVETTMQRECRNKH